MARSVEPALRWLQDREALRQLMVDYFCGVDDRDFERVAGCFTTDVRAHYDKLYEGREPLVEFIRGVRFFHTTLHCMGAQLIDVVGDEAQMFTGAMIAHHGRKGDGEEFQYCNSDSRYVDGLSYEGGRWLVRERGGATAMPAVWTPAPIADDPALRWLIDRAQVRDLLARWAFAMDQRDEARVRACLAPDFCEVEADRLEGSEAFVSRAKGLQRLASVSHFLGLPAIDLRGDEAIVESCCLVTEREPGEPQKHPVLGFPAREERTRSARWRDRLVRTKGSQGAGGLWRLSERGSGVQALATDVPDPPTTTDPETRELLDRELLRDAIARSALAKDRESGATNHLVGNQEIELRGDEARVRSYVYRTRRANGRESHWGMGPLHWHDRFERRSGGSGSWDRVEHSEVDLLANT